MFINKKFLICSTYFLINFNMNRHTLFFIFITSFIFSFKLFSQTPVINQQPIGFTKCVGNTGILSVSASGTEPLSYQWYKDNNPISGATQNQLILSSLQTSDMGDYFCRISNIHGSTDSYTAHIVVAENSPQITSINSQYNIICIGATNTFNAVYSGDYVTCRWYRNENQIGLGSEITISDAQLNNEGYYWCIAENVCGYDISDSLFLEIATPAQILTQPQTQTVCEGSDVTWTVEASGDYLGFIWMKNGYLLPSQQTNSITIQNVSYPNNDNYRLIVYNLCNQDTTVSVYINVNTAPIIAGQPLSSSNCVNNNVTLHAVGTSTTELSYQWYNTDTGIIPGANSTELIVTYQPNDTTGYYCIISNYCGTISTDTAIIITKMPPIITQQPIGAEVCVGTNVTLIAKATGTEPINFQWLFNDANVYGANITGSQTNTMQISSIFQGQEGWYKCNVSNMCGTTQTNEVFVKVNIPPVIIEQPLNSEVCEGTQIYYNIYAEGSNPLTYEWHKIGINEIISNTSELNFESSTPENTGEYYCLVSNMCGNISTDTINITIKANVEILQNPENIEACLGDYIELTVVATGAEPLEYLWYRNGTAESSQTSSNLIIPSAQLNTSGTYFCRVINECGYEDSETAEVVIGTFPVITWQPVGFNMCELDTLNLIMDAEGENYALQWYHNGQPIPGANDTVLNISIVNVNHSGIYYCLAYNACATVSTDTVNIEIYPAPALSLGNDIDLCQGDGAVMIGTEGNYEHYNWNNGYSYQPFIEVNQTGTYVLQVIGTNGCYNRDTIKVTYHPYHQIMFGEPQIIACGPYNLNAGAGAYSYIWNTGAITQTITVTQTGTYSVTTTGDYFGCSSTATVFIEVREPVNIDLGPDVSAPVNSFVEIGVPPIYSEYFWNTGYSGPMLSVYGSIYGIGTHTFWLTVTGFNGCNATDTIKVTFTPASNITEISNSSILIYPNPAIDFVFIKSDFNINKLEIFNLSGNILFNEMINNKEYLLKINNFAVGEYILKFSDNLGNYYISKILIEK